MADVADLAAEFVEAHLDRSIRAAVTAPFDPGVPGECDNCLNDSPRLVKGICARCREPKKGYARG
jgi:hypothetical protein